MSYDLRLKDPQTGDTIHLSRPHGIAGGTYALGGTTEAWINITYNYGAFFRQVFGENGISVLHGLTGADSLPVLEKAIGQLHGGRDLDYWKATEGNAKSALLNMALLAGLAPHGIWDVS